MNRISVYTYCWFLSDIYYWVHLNRFPCWQEFSILQKMHKNEHSRPILEVKGMGAMSQKKDNEMLKKGKIFENLGENVKNLKIFWKNEGD